MRSLRSRFEVACRIGAFALIGWLLGTSVMPSSARRVERASSSEIEARLAEWTRTGPTVGLYGNFEIAPNAWIVDWLGALRRSGRAIAWGGAPPAFAVAPEALTDPRGGVRVNVAAPAGTTVQVRDAASPIDSIRVAALGGSVTTPALVGDVVATDGRQSASAISLDSVRIKPIAVIGQASWEGRFIAAALEERGWPVVTRFSVAPGVFVNTNQPIVLDTSRLGAVIAVDTSIQSLGASLGRFVRNGGGLVLAGSAGAASAVSDLAPGQLGARFRPAVLPRDTVSLGATGFYPVSSLRSDAIALERRVGGVSVAARRVGAGRVLQIGYDDSWRWRMAGGEGSENAHRAWWARIAGAVAYAPLGAPIPVAGNNSAPLAYLIDKVGPPRQVPVNATRAGLVDHRIFLVLILVLLLTEWTSRRLRGLK